MARQLTLNLAPVLSAPAHARRTVAQHFAGQVDPKQIADVSILISELVSNAVIHGTGEVTVRVQLDGDLLRGEVIDQGGGFEHEIRARGADDVSGRGLLLVEALSSSWGIHEGTTHVWFELSTGSNAPGRPRPQLGESERPGSLD